MPKNLVIVESPAKAQTIEKYLGGDFEVLSSMGHVRDLPKSGLGIDIKHNFRPKYEILPDKTKVVSILKKASKNKQVWLATDEDREGEAISWHLCSLLDINPKLAKRITFHEITRSAIQKAIKNPKNINLALVDAQQARRVLDRLVGYELSPILWKKIKTGLSAGRVQSVAVRLIVEREKAIEGFEQKFDYKITAKFKTNSGEIFIAELESRLPSSKSVKRFLNSLVNKNFSVETVERKPSKKSPAPPFTTSTLQQAASSKLGYSVKQTMLLAQKLYESGKITYMRTDSVYMANQAINQAKRVIEANFGKDYHQMRQYKAKTKSAQEAHEAIRPTSFILTKASNDKKQQKLYQLIRARALASQMVDAQIERTQIRILTKETEGDFIAKGEIIIFPGYLKAYQQPKPKQDDILPYVKQGEKLNLEDAVGIQTFARPPARYTEASLVKKLETEGIGRPSTYAPIISTIQTRGYIQKTNGKGKERIIKVLKLENQKVKTYEEIERYDTDRSRLMPTEIATIVTDFLIKYFPQIIDLRFTAQVEEGFDKIAQGKQKWQQMIEDFYKPFHKLIEKSESISRQEANKGRVLGKDPETGKVVIARFGKYGAMIQMGEADDEEKPKFAPMPNDKKIENITLAEALNMFKLPRRVGRTKNGQEITANIGRFGPYISAGGKNFSIQKFDPFTISEKQALSIIDEAKKAEKQKVIQSFKKLNIQVLNGRYGPYITDGTINVRVPYGKDPNSISAEECQKLIEQKFQKIKK